MATWDTYQSSDTLNLNANYQIFQLSSSDWIIQLKPGELASVDIEYDAQNPSPTENLDVVIEMSGNGIKFETAGEAQRHIIYFNNRESDADPIRNVSVTGVHYFRIKGRLRTPSDGAGGSDTATAQVHIVKDGVDAGSLP